MNYRAAYFFFLVFLGFFLIFSRVHALTLLKPSINNLGLIGHWTFDGADIVGGKPQDKSGQGNHASLVNIASSTFYTEGKIGQGFNFDGVDDFGNVGDPASEIYDFGTTQDFSLSIWMKGGGASQYLLAKYNSGASAGWSLPLNSTGKAAPFIRDGTVGGGGEIVQVTGNTTITDGNWHHVVATFDRDGNLTLYVDGVSDATPSSIAIITDTVSNAENVNIGRRSAGFNFGGILDDPRIYNRVLPATEVRALYNHGAGAKVNVVTSKNILGPAVHLTFDGKDILTGLARDVTGNSNHGGLVNMSTSTSRDEGKIGQALLFDGVDDYVTLGDVVTDAQTKLTWSFWAKQSALQDQRCYIAKANPNGLSQMSWMICNESSTVFGSIDDISVGVYPTLTSNPASGMCNPQSAEIPLNEWFHVAAVFDGSLSTNQNRLKIYLNGTQRTFTDGQCGGGADIIPSVTTNSTEDIVIGHVSDQQSSRAINASMDDVRIYQRALSETEISQLYNIGKYGSLIKNLTSGNLVVRYFVDEATSGTSPTQIFDTSGNNYHLTNVDYGSGNMSFAETSQKNSGLNSTSVTGVQRARRGIGGAGDVVFDALNGATKATLEVVVKLDSSSSNVSRIFAITDRSGSAGTIAFAHDADGSALDATGGTGAWKVSVTNSFRSGFAEVSTSRAVFHLVVDTTQESVNNRAKMYKNGIPLSISNSSVISQNTLLTLTANNSDLILLNRESSGSFDRSIVGAVYYAALYNKALTQAEITNNAKLLLSNDDRY